MCGGSIFESYHVEAWKILVLVPLAYDESKLAVPFSRVLPRCLGASSKIPPDFISVKLLASRFGIVSLAQV